MLGSIFCQERRRKGNGLQRGLGRQSAGNRKAQPTLSLSPKTGLTGLPGWEALP